jgi:glycerol-3-phosphate acyltransferase PlsX
VVTDGFTGNVTLKTLEGAVRLAVAEMRETLTAGRIARFGALFQRSALRRLRERLDADTYGGGVLLGLNGTVVIAHGDSRASAISAACVLARDLAGARTIEQIAEFVPTRSHRFIRRPDDIER